MRNYQTFTEAFWSLLQQTTGIIPTDEGKSRIDAGTNSLKTTFPRLSKEVARSIPHAITERSDFKSWRSGKPYGMAKKKKQMATMAASGSFVGVDMMDEDAMGTVMAEPSCMGLMPGDGSDEEGNEELVAWNSLSWSGEADELRRLGGGVNSELKLVGRKFILQFFKTLKLNDQKINSLDEGLKWFVNLEELSVSNNSLTVLENLPSKVKILHADSNGLSNITDLDGISLVHLGLAFNNFSDIKAVVPPVEYDPESTIPPCIPETHPLATLISLDLSNNNLQDLMATCESLQLLHKLKHLCMYKNPFCISAFYRTITLAMLQTLKNLDEVEIFEEDRIAAEQKLAEEEEIMVPKEYGEDEEVPEEPEMVPVMRKVVDSDREKKIVLCIDSMDGIVLDTPAETTDDPKKAKGGKDAAPTGPPPNTIHVEFSAFGEDFKLDPVEEAETVEFNFTNTFSPEWSARLRDYITLHGIEVVVTQTKYFFIEKELTEEERLAKEAAEAEAAANKKGKGAPVAEEEKEVGFTVSELGRAFIKCPNFFDGVGKGVTPFESALDVKPVEKVDYTMEIMYRKQKKKYKPKPKPEPMPLKLNVRVYANALEDPQIEERRKAAAEAEAAAGGKKGKKK